jgi:5-methylcytosine-specific restriction endonuclease McrA
MVKNDAKFRRRLRRGNVSRARASCFYCHTTFDWDDPVSEFYPTLDHKIPASKGGGRGANLVMACLRCNQEKGTMSVAEFMEYLEVTKGCVGRVQRMIRWAKHRGTFKSAMPIPETATSQ